MICDAVRLEELLLGDLDEREWEALSLHLAECRNCRERLRVLSGLMALQEVHETRTWRRRRLGKLAAALALAAGLALLSPHSESPPDAQRMATASPYFRFPLQARSSAAHDTARQRAFAAYRAADYESAAELFSKLPAEPEAAFFGGVSLYLSNRPEQALARLQDARQDPRWRLPALWYEANAHLKAGRLGRAREILREVAGKGSEFSDQAQRLLGELNRSERR